MSKNPVVHFEMGYEDRDRMMKFYETALGWNLQSYGEEMGNYVVAHTADTDENGMVKTPGTINGGFYDKTEKGVSKVPSVVVSVDDMQEALKAVETNGGKILGVLNPQGDLTKEPQMIPGVGLWMSVEDTEGNRFSLLQAKLV